MKKNAELNHEALLHSLGVCSGRMAQHHYLDNLSEFVLHDLCSKDMFNVSKAAYLVNNADFACLQGVAGYESAASFGQDHWNQQHDFTRHMEQSKFNGKVRKHQDRAIEFDGSKKEHDRIQRLADQFEIEYPNYHVWNMKHDNQGVIIFDDRDLTDGMHEHMHHFVSMLSFCPIF